MEPFFLMKKSPVKKFKKEMDGTNGLMSNKSKINSVKPSKNGNSCKMKTGKTQ